MPLFLRPLPPLLLALSLAGCLAPPKNPRARPLQPWRFSDSVKTRLGARLDAAAGAWNDLAVTNRTRRARAEADYEAALAGLLRTWNQAQAPSHWHDGAIFTSGGRRYRIRFASDAKAVPVPATQLANLRLATEIRSGRAEEITAEGLGVPVVGQLNDPDAHPLLPPNGAQLALTALLEFGPPSPGQAREVHLRLINPLQQPRRRVAGRDWPLAANYTAAKTLALDDGSLKKFSLVGLFYPEKTLANSRIYQLDPYDPQRIPVVFVHGLMSDPHIWYPCINALYADPVLRARYQPWYFLYPTGMAVPATSVRLRESLAEAHRRLDPQAQSAALQRMVLVGHSMGGLLSRMQAIDSGTDFWSAHFRKPPEALRLSAGSRERLTRSLVFERRPEVARLIFITVPHRGSKLADKGFAMRLARFVRLPVDSLLLAKDLFSGNTDALQPQIQDWGPFAFLSLSSLSPRHPYLDALNAKPIPVPHHSIIGRANGRTLEDSSDLVVPYRSAHLETGSELVVPYWHGCAEKPEVVAEVLRRLHQHLRESPTP
jgi:pimeloyl-ACP methyl ester carboxylesterase